ncbi:MAG: hypothetical protein COA45_12500 [Zetaproteobacteria bacterium]|nr:MAG: hypothetical protein COA45_12500 [Zetaproteobacteria bacterium]
MKFIAFLGVILLLTFASSGSAFAKTPKCGDIGKRDIRDVFDDAKDVRFYYDVRDDLDVTCALLEEFNEWESVQDRGKLSGKSYKMHKGDIIDGVKRSIIAMGRPLTVMRVWLRLKPKSTEGERTRVIRILDAKRDVKVLQAKLQKMRLDLRILMR